MIWTTKMDSRPCWSCLDPLLSCNVSLVMMSGTSAYPIISPTDETFRRGRDPLTARCQPDNSASVSVVFRFLLITGSH